MLGNFEVDSLDSPDPDAPVVYVDGISALGNIEARARKGRRVANALANPATSDRMRKYLRF